MDLADYNNFEEMYEGFNKEMLLLQKKNIKKLYFC